MGRTPPSPVLPGHASVPQSPPRYVVDEVRWATIGGVPQAFHFLARDPAAPVLLVLHGGPGVPHMPFAYVNAALADSFVVVNWDQRGAGKSYAGAKESSRLTLARLVSDGCNAIQYLCDDFKQRRIFVVGHSCGSALGVMLAAKCPKRIRAFVGIGQVSNLRTAEKERFRAARHLACTLCDTTALRALEQVGPPPYRCGSERDELERVAAGLRGDCLDPFSDQRYWPIARSCPLYDSEDWQNRSQGTHYSQACLWEEVFHQVDLSAQVPKLDIPVGFLTGEHDTLSPLPVAQRYFEVLRAPQGKRFARLRGVGHWPHLEAPTAYRSALCAFLGAN